MTPDRSQPDFEEELLARFLRELEAVADRCAVVRAYAARHPALGDELARLEEMNRLVARVGRDESAAVPPQLGEFRIVRRITGGGMGDIYEAVQDRLNRRVVVKTMRRGRIAEHSRGRFFREQRVLARLHQTHIVPIHTAGEEGDLLYFVMPFIDGAPLDTLVRAAVDFESRGPGSKTPSLVGLVVQAGTAPEEPTITSTRTGRRRVLSADYFRSVAQVLADAAEAVEHAHRLNILHRDLKPSNMLIDRQGQCWVIDFGLAGYLGHAGGPSNGPVTDDAEGLTVGGIIGTPQYMAPEQWRGEPADVRTDVWGLGATLYEMLTLTRAFDGPSDLHAQERVLADDPPPPRTLVRNIPWDLAAICRKALSKDPAKRYSTAQAFADDLRRWLRHEPVSARPAWVARRVTLWAQRNRGWAASLCTLLACSFIVVGLMFRHERLQALTAQREGAVRLAKLVQEIRPQATGEAGTDSWRTRLLQSIRDVHRLQPEDDLREQAASVLIGMDAERTHSFPFAASSAAFDGTGQRILFGGANDRNGTPNAPARLVDLATGSTELLSPLLGCGPVAFRPNGEPVQVAPIDRWTLMLRDLTDKQPPRRLSLADAAPGPLTERNYPVMAIASDASLVAASTILPDGHGILRVWDGRTGEHRHEFAERANCLTFSPDGSLLAFGDDDGLVTVRNTKSGERVASIPCGQLAIKSVALGRDPIRSDDPPHDNWLLATGDAGARIIIWDLATGLPRIHCDGVGPGIFALALSPDGATLASAELNTVHLWDTATGRLLLTIGFDATYIAGTVFDPAGQQLAIVGPAPGPNFPPGRSPTRIMRLNRGSGAMGLHGLHGQVQKIAVSSDERWLAALSHQWQIGIWDLSTGRLVRMHEAPRGEFADNADLIFDETGTLVASAAGTEVKLWRVATGELLRRWTLPSGLQDALAFDPSGTALWSARCETAKKLPPHSDADPREHPRICVIRNLYASDPAERRHVIDSFPAGIEFIRLAPDASFLVVNGNRTSDRRDRSVRIFDLPLGREIWSSPAGSSTLSWMQAVGQGRAELAVSLRGDKEFVKIEMPSRNQKTHYETDPRIQNATNAFSVTGKIDLAATGAATVLLNPFRQVDSQPLFSPRGRFLTVGRFDGRVIVYDLEPFWQNLAEFGPAK